jgi:hypothetical protein
MQLSAFSHALNKRNKSNNIVKTIGTVTSGTVPVSKLFLQMFGRRAPDGNVNVLKNAFLRPDVHAHKEIAGPLETNRLSQRF